MNHMHKHPCCESDAMPIAITALNNITAHSENTDIHVTPEEKEQIESALSKINDFEGSVAGFLSADALNDYYNKQWVDDALKMENGFITNIPANYITEEWLDEKLQSFGESIGSKDDLSLYLKIADFNARIANYATKDWVNGEGYLKSVDLTDYATKTWVTAQLGNQGGNQGGNVNLSNYYTKSEADAKFALKGSGSSGSHTTVSYTPTITESSAGVYKIGDLIINGSPTPIYGKDLVGGGGGEVQPSEKVYSYAVRLFTHTNDTTPTPSAPFGVTFNMSTKSLENIPDWWKNSMQDDWFNKGYIWVSYNNYFSDGTNSGWTTPSRWFNIDAVLSDADTDWQTAIDEAIAGVNADIESARENFRNGQALLQAGIDGLESTLGARITGIEDSVKSLNGDVVAAAVSGIVRLYSWVYVEEDEVPAGVEFIHTVTVAESNSAGGPDKYLSDNYTGTDYLDKYAKADHPSGYLYLHYTATSVSILNQVAAINEELDQLNTAVIEINADEIRSLVAALDNKTNAIDTAVQQIDANKIRQQVTDYVDSDNYKTSMILMLSDRIELAAAGSDNNGASLTLKVGDNESTVNITADKIGLNGDVIASMVAAKGLDINNKTHINSDGSINIANGSTYFDEDGSGWTANGLIWWNAEGEITEKNGGVYGTITSALRIINNDNLKNYCVNPTIEEQLRKVTCKTIQGTDVDGYVLDISKVGTQMSLLGCNGDISPIIVDLPAYVIGVTDATSDSLKIRGVITDDQISTQNILSYMAWCNGYLGQKMIIYVPQDSDHKKDKFYIRGLYSGEYQSNSSYNMINEIISFADLITELGNYVFILECDTFVVNDVEQVGWNIIYKGKVDSFSNIVAGQNDAIAKNTMTYEICLT